MNESLDKTQAQKTHSNPDAVNALDLLLQSAGFDAGDLYLNCTSLILTEFWRDVSYSFNY